MPESYRADRPWPLLLTLHGGVATTRILWTWLKYAKSRGYLLVSAKSFGPTWFPWDAPSLMFILDEMQERYHVDPERMLLTGLSMGARSVMKWALPGLSVLLVWRSWLAYYGHTSAVPRQTTCLSTSRMVPRISSFPWRISAWS